MWYNGSFGSCFKCSPSCGELLSDLRRRDIEGKQRLENDFVSAPRSRWVVQVKSLLFVASWQGSPSVQMHQLLDSGC